MLRQGRVEGGRQFVVAALLGNGRGNFFGAAVDVNFCPELMNQLGVGQCPVAAAGDQAMAGDQRIEVVLAKSRVEGARQFDGAHRLGDELKAAGRRPSKSELVRAGIAALSARSTAEVMALVDTLSPAARAKDKKASRKKDKKAANKRKGKSANKKR